MNRRVWAFLIFAFMTNAQGAIPPEFIQIKKGALIQNGRPYFFVGANLWYGMNLGSTGTGGGRDRLVRELDRLNSIGVKNLRILAGSEGPNAEPWRIAPALQVAPGVYDPDLFAGLDFLLNEMKKRGMRAVLCLNDFWPWSGGMSQYQRWFGGEPIPYPPPEPGGSWSYFQDYTTDFYSNSHAKKAFTDFIRILLTRFNTFTGIPYSEDPTIMAWELANEPRGGTNGDAFNDWIDETAREIKSLDPLHLVTTGSEGETRWPISAGLDVIRNHSSPAIDYVTAHVWVQNWGWFDPANGSTSLPKAILKMKDYIRHHVALSQKLNKPLVLEEFGISRDGNSHDPSSTTQIRDHYFAEVFTEVLREATRGLTRKSPTIAGANFWAWGGEGRPVPPFGGYWRSGDPWIGDPPHETQGWYSVYDSDASTIRVISSYAKRMSRLGR